jgi:hypothetical protein
MAEAGLLSTAPAYAVLVRFVSHPHGPLCPHGQSRTVVLNWRFTVQLVGGANPLLNHDICADAFSLLRATASTLYLSLFNFVRDCLFWSRQCRYPIQFHQNLPVSSLPLPLNRSPLGFSRRTPSQARRRGRPKCGMWGFRQAQAACCCRWGEVASKRRRRHAAGTGRLHRSAAAATCG